MAATDLSTSLATDLASGLAGGASLSPQQLLGAPLIEYWESDAPGALGGASATWPGMIVPARALTGSGSPVLGTSGANWRGKPVFKFVRASSQAFDSGNLGSLLPIGRPMMIVVGRQTANVAADQRVVHLFDGAIAADNQLGLQVGSGTGNTEARIEGATIGIVSGPFSLLPHTYALYLDAAGVRTWDADGVNIVTNGTGVNTTAAVGRVLVGGIPSLATGFCDCEVAGVYLLSAFPGAAAYALFLSAYIRPKWGTP